MNPLYILIPFLEWSIFAISSYFKYLVKYFDEELAGSEASDEDFIPSDVEEVIQLYCDITSLLIIF